MINTKQDYFKEKMYFVFLEFMTQSVSTECVCKSNYSDSLLLSVVCHFI